MGRYSLGEVTSEGSKGEKRFEGGGVRFCEESKVLHYTLATSLATVTVFQSFVHGCWQKTDFWIRDEGLYYLLHIKQCGYHVPVGLPFCPHPKSLWE